MPFASVPSLILEPTGWLWWRIIGVFGNAVRVQFCLHATWVVWVQEMGHGKNCSNFARFPERPVQRADSVQSLYFARDVSEWFVNRLQY